KSAEDRETFAKFAVAQETARRAVGRIEDRVVGVPGAGVAEAAEATAAGTNMRGQHRLDATAPREIRMADNPSARAGPAVDAARAHGGDAVDELGFTDRPHLDRACGARHRPRLHEYGGDDVVAARGVRQQLVEQIAPAGPVPEMMVWIDD